MARGPASNGNGSSNGNGKAPVAGQDPKTGKFVPGNKLGKGGLHYAAKRRQFQAILLKATTPQRMGKIVQTFLRLAERGEPWAMKEFFERFLGKEKVSVEIDGDIRVSFWDVIAQLREKEGAACPPSRN